MKTLLSYLTDSDDLIRLLKTTKREDGTHFLTMDVTSLYSNIEHEIGIACVKAMLKQDPEITTVQREFFLKALHLILYNYFFKLQRRNLSPEKRDSDRDQDDPIICESIYGEI